MSESNENESGFLPDPRVCRTRVLKAVALVECLVKSPQRCPYVLAFGTDFFCQHPDCREFEKPSGGEV
ncbi:MAG TPA: hypothetical protein VMP11_15745 [Verrucomicrobiae bacterium]|nr:hypothetical protein [Verrucomicrobiae bacterium]